MTCLEQQQRALLALIKKRPMQLGDSEEYVQRVATSEELGLLREIALWWRALGIERNCPYTAQLLKRIGRFEVAVEAFYCLQATSPYMEQMAAQFAEALSTDSDPLVRAMATFELALLRITQGDLREFVIEWDRNPATVFAALQSGDPLPQSRGDHRITVGGVQPAARSHPAPPISNEEVPAKGSSHL